jgi:hypothetical protein
MIAIEKKQALANARHAEAVGTQPKWVRVSTASAACEIGRTRLYELLNESNGRIRTCLLKSPGAERGARLINLPSLFAYLEDMAAKQQGGQSR